MADELQHKSSVELDNKLKQIVDAKEIIPPHLIAPAMIAGGSNFVSWVDKALQEAQEDKEIALGRRPPKIITQPNPAVSLWQSVWKNAHMNNNRELGPGDLSKKK